MSTQETPIYSRPAKLLQTLIRFDTTNPPGNEGPCVLYIKGLLEEAGITATLLALDDSRPNLIARLKGRGDAPPLLLYGHVDVVTTENQQWTHPPFAAEIHDGFIWGRGALDMKGAVAMMVSAFLRAHAEGADLPGDVILAIVPDEENLGRFGAGFLVEQHPEVFAGVRYALGEFGGFTMYSGGRRFYPIMVAEKQVCWLRVALHGPGGHGSMPVRGGAMARMAEVVRRLDSRPLPVHITPVARAMFETLAGALPFPQSAVLRGLLTPALTDRVLGLLGEQGRLFHPLLHNTVSPTGVSGSSKINVIPGEVTLELDGRILPGFTKDDLLLELHRVIGMELDYEVVDYYEYPKQPDMALFDTLGGVLREMDPQGIPMPLLLAGVTDGRFLARLGIQTYGFTPIQLPPDFTFTAGVHAADERIPVEAVDFGTEAIYRALQRFDRTG
ncbi:MAG: M20/M25/M40 family metallo-hydrolase [Anaerolineae bacterium]